MLLLVFTPLYGLILSANVAQKNTVARVMAYILTGLVNAVLVLFGTLAVVGDALNVIPAVGMIEGMDFTTAGIIFLITGLVGLMALVPQVRATILPLLRLSLDPDNMVHTVALNLAIWAIGANLGIVTLSLGVPTETMAASMESVSLLTLWDQAAVWVIISLLGVGFGLRRGWTETRERLGLGGLTWKQAALLPAIIIGLVLMQYAITLLWAFVDPDGLERIGEITGSLLQDAITPLGVITIGLSAGIGEELLLRGAVQPRFGIVFTTIIFAVLHTQYELSFATLTVLLLSVVFGLLRRYMNTTACIIVHTGYNSVLVLVSLITQSITTAP